MHHKSFGTLIQGRFSEFSFIDKFDLTSGRQGLCNGISPLGKLLSTKLKVCIAKGEEKHSYDHIHTGVGQQEGFLKKSNPFLTIQEQKISCDHTICL